MRSMINQFWDALKSALRPDNPMIFRDFRRELRKPRLFLTVTILAISILFLLVSGLGLIYIGKNNPTQWHTNLGGNADLNFVIACSTFHFWFIVYTSKTRIHGMLAKEAALDGMTSLLMLPMNRLELVLKSLAYPSLTGLMVSVLLLPIYIASVALNGLTWAELFALYALFALVSISVPVFVHPALSGNIAGELSTPGEDKTGATSARSGGIFSQDKVKRAVRGGTSIVSIPAGMYIVLFVLVGMITGNLSAAIQTVSKYVPPHILELVPGFVFTLPMLCARLFGYPLGWFAFQLPPVIPILVITFVFRALQALKTSHYLSIGTRRELPTLPTYLPYRKSCRVLLYCTVITACGYLWPAYIRDRMLLGHISGQLATGSALGAFVTLTWTLAVFWTVFRFCRLGDWMSKRSDARGVQITGHTALRFAAEPCIVTVIGVLTCMLLSGDFKIGVTAWKIMGTQTLVGAAFAFSSFALCRITPWLLVPGGVATVCISLFSQNQALLAFSPTMTIMSHIGVTAGPVAAAITSSQRLPAGIPACTVLCTALGALSFAAYAAVSRMKKSASAIEFSSVLDPTLVGDEPFSDPADRAGQKASSGREDDIQHRIVAAVQRFVDNPMTIRDLRAWLRSGFKLEVIVALAVCAVIAIIAVMVWLPATVPPAEWLVPDFAAQSDPLMIAGKLSALLVITIGIMFMAAFSSAFRAINFSFASDRRRSTLAFVFTSPMTDAEVTRGRCLSVVLYCGAPIYACFVFGLFFTIVLCAATGSLQPLVSILWLLLPFILFVPTCLVSVALGSMYPNLTASRAGGCLRSVANMGILYIGSLIAFLLYSIIYSIMGGSGASAATYAILVTGAVLGGAAVGISLLAYMLILATLRAMRKGNVDNNIAVH